MKLKRNKHQAGILKVGSLTPNPYVMNDPMQAFYERQKKIAKLKKKHSESGQYWDFSRKLKTRKFKSRGWTDEEITAGYVRSQMLEEMSGAEDGEGSGILSVSEVLKRIKEEQAKPSIKLTSEQTAEFFNSGQLPPEILKQFGFLGKDKKDAR